MENNKSATALASDIRQDSPIRFRNAIQRDDAIGTLLDTLGLGELWDDGGPTKRGIEIACESYADTSDSTVVIMRAACQLYRLHGGRNGPRNPNVDIIRFWQMPSNALAMFGSLMVAMSNGYDDVDEWIEMTDEKLDAADEENSKKSA